MELREIEKTNIECDRKFFSELNEHIDADTVKYGVVADNAELMDVVTGWWREFLE